MTRRALLLSAPLVLAAGGCEEYGPRIYTAHPYRAEAACLEPSVPIGIVKAADLPVQCEPVCLLLDATLYVSSVCPPQPERALRLAPDAPDCAAAATLLRTETFCVSLPPELELAPDASSLDGGRADARPTPP
jgi:hypothetical protein